MYRVADIQKWGNDRGLYEQSNFEAQYEKLLEEFVELYSAIRTNNAEEVKDAIGDNYVVLVHLATLCGMDVHQTQRTEGEQYRNFSTLHDSVLLLLYSYTRLFAVRSLDLFHDVINTLVLICEGDGLNFEDCVDGAVETINKRTGRFINGVYVKDPTPVA